MKKTFYILMASVLTMLSLSVFTGNVYAEYTIKEMTPAVQSALENRRDRYEQIRTQKLNHTIGENNQGYVEKLAGGDDVQALVKAENKDRKVIYQTIAEQNDLTEALDVIEEVFARVQREKAETGDKVQLPDGKWISKK